MITHQLMRFSAPGKTGWATRAIGPLGHAKPGNWLYLRLERRRLVAGALPCPASGPEPDGSGRHRIVRAESESPWFHFRRSNWHHERNHVRPEKAESPAYAGLRIAGAGLEPSPLTLQGASYRIAETRDIAGSR